MIEILTASDRFERSEIFDQMFRGRAKVFYERLGWNVVVKDGFEIDLYDEGQDPVYLVAINDGGEVSGSLRLLPTTGKTMLANEFSPFFEEPVEISSPLVWECTRFCIHPIRNSLHAESGQSVSSELLIGLCQLAMASGIEQIVGLYEYKMTRVYNRIGWCPTPLAVSRPEIGRLVAGVWNVSQTAVDEMNARASIVRNADVTSKAA